MAVRSGEVDGFTDADVLEQRLELVGSNRVMPPKGVASTMLLVMNRIREAGLDDDVDFKLRGDGTAAVLEVRTLSDKEEPVAEILQKTTKEFAVLIPNDPQLERNLRQQRLFE